MAPPSIPDALSSVNPTAHFPVVGTVWSALELVALLRVAHFSETHLLVATRTTIEVGSTCEVCGTSWDTHAYCACCGANIGVGHRSRTLTGDLCDDCMVVVRRTTEVLCN